MDTQEIRITAQISLEVPIELSKEELEEMFNCAQIEILETFGNQRWSHTYKQVFKSTLEIISIEEETELYNTEE